MGGLMGGLRGATLRGATLRGGLRGGLRGARLRLGGGSLNKEVEWRQWLIGMQGRKFK